MKNKFFLTHLMIPVLIMAVLAGAIMLEKQGAAGEAYEPRLEILEKMTGEVNQSFTSTPGVVILYHGTDTFESASKQAVTDTLDAMRIAFRAVDLSQEKLPSLTDISMLLFSCRSFAPFENNLEELITWIDQGGKFGIMMAPAVDSSFLVLYRKLGILDFGYELKLFYSLEYTTGLLPLWGDRVFDYDLDDYSLIVRLEPDCIVHMQTADSLKIPLLWERRINKGRIAVLNNSLLLGKNSRGFAVAVLFALEDTMIYPIINAGMVYLDDFPAPQPEGYDQNLLDQYGYSVEDMYKKTWWPDMKYLAKTHGLRYTGGLIETYNDDVIPPFTPGNIDITQITFYGGEILRSGGEIGLHGFNHMPLSPPGFPYAADEPYLTWPSADYMQASIAELNRYGKELMPDIRLTTYVPPSNYLSDIGRAALLKAAPELRVISAVYMTGEGTAPYVQEFKEEIDGIISVPRISSGYVLDGFANFLVAQELMFHGVFSHFVHPDDILDQQRGSLLGWDEMYREFSALIASVDAAYPMLRFSTASEGAAAVQRYDRLGVSREDTEKELTVQLSDFYDNAWMALKTSREIVSIQGGELFAISEDFYWIRADEPKIIIRWGLGS